MKRYACLLGAFLAFVTLACAPEVRVLDAPTQVTLSIDTKNAALKKSLDRVSVTVSRLTARGDAGLNGEWRASGAVVIARSEGATWPLDVPILPTHPTNDSSYLETVVEARDGDRILTQARALTRFEPGSRRRLELWLEPCAERELGFVCTDDPDCHGASCTVCDAQGECVPTTYTAPKDLERLDEPAGGAAGPGAPKKDAGKSDGETPGVDGPAADAGPGAAGPGVDGGLGDVVPVGCSAEGAGRCDENATCTLIDDVDTCRCKSPYVGDGETCTLDEDCADLACDPMAECATVDGKLACRCPTGYTGSGKTCENVDECKKSPAPCDAQATCTDSPGSFVCACKPGFSGPGTTCTKVDACATNPCQHGGICADGAMGATCDCAGTGYSGALCEVDVDDCAAKPCLNNGVCSDAVKGFVCDCSKTGFTGATCQSNVDDCASNPCMHSGKCTDGVGTSQCDCAGTGFTGARCETNVNDCSPNPCKNGATCTDGIDTVTCKCAAGFSGDRCETNIDDCTAGRCMNGGTCVDGVNKATCTCKPGWTGPRCETTACGNGVRDPGEDCDPTSSPNAKWTCDPECRSTKLYNFCEGPTDCANGTQCWQQGICTVQCSTATACPAVFGEQPICQGLCRVPCTRLSDCPPGTFCLDDGGGASVCFGKSGTIQGLSCTDDPFGCPQGSTCDTNLGMCVGRKQ